MTRKSLLLLAASALLVASCDSAPTSPDGMLAQFDQVDPVVMIFNSTYGLPEGPFAGADRMPFFGALALPPGANIQRPAGPGAGPRAPGAPLPDSLKLTAAQRVQIQALIVAFVVANKTDLDAMSSAHQAARAAHQAGKSREEIRALLEAAKPAAERVRAASQALHTAVQGVLTPAQRAWIEAHRPTEPFRLPS